MVARHCEKNKWGMPASGYEVSFDVDKNVLKLDSGDACMTL